MRRPTVQNKIRRRLANEAKQAAKRRAIEAQFPKLKPGELDPRPIPIGRGVYNPPGYFRRGRLKGVVYTDRNRRGSGWLFGLRAGLSRKAA